MKTNVNLRKLVEVFDERKDEYKGHTTPITGLIGEDLNTAIFIDYLKRRRKVKEANPLRYLLSTGQDRGRGPRLDRWIIADNKLYQVEIKSWCSFQTGGYKLLLVDNEQKTKELAHEKWKRELREHYKDIKTFGKVSKVLAKMKIPDDLKAQYKKAEPLVIHWMPISKEGINPFFSHPVKDLGMNKMFTKQIQKNFTTVYYFSCSLYVRELINKDKKKSLELDLPNVDKRRGILEKLIK